MIHLKEITEQNFYEVLQMSNSLEEYQKKSVASNVVSLAQAYLNKDIAWPRAIYYNDQPVGFLMLKLVDNDIPKTDQPSYYLWRLMISRENQGKGYGKQALDLVIQKCKEDKVKYLYTSCTMHHKMPYMFYTNYGFTDLNERDGDEEILKYQVYSE